MEKKWLNQELEKYFKIADFAFGFHPDYDELYKYGLCPLKTYDYMFHKLPILFVGEKSYLDVKSPGIISCKFNDKNDFNLNLHKIYNMSKNELVDKGLQNYNIVKMQNSPESISKVFLEILL